MPLPRPRHALFATLAAAMLAACSVHPSTGPFAFPPAAPAAPPALAVASAAGGTAPAGSAAGAADPGRIVDCGARTNCLPPRCAAPPRWRWPPERPVVVAASAAAMAPALVNVCAPVVNAGGGESAPASAPAAAPRASEAGEGEAEAGSHRLTFKIDKLLEATLDTPSLLLAGVLVFTLALYVLVPLALAVRKALAKKEGGLTPQHVQIAGVVCLSLVLAVWFVTRPAAIAAASAAAPVEDAALRTALVDGQAAVASEVARLRADLAGGARPPWDAASGACCATPERGGRASSAPCALPLATLSGLLALAAAVLAAGWWRRAGRPGPATAADPAAWVDAFYAVEDPLLVLLRAIDPERAESGDGDAGDGAASAVSAKAAGARLDDFLDAAQALRRQLETGLPAPRRAVARAGPRRRLDARLSREDRRALWETLTALRHLLWERPADLPARWQQETLAALVGARREALRLSEIRVRPRLQP